MRKPKSNVAPQVEANATTQVEVAPVEVATPAPAAPAKKALRYAGVHVLANPQAVITYLRPQYHKNPNSLTYRKYALFEAGLSVAQIEAKFVENNWPRLKARNQLRWEIEHGNVVLEAPAPATPAAE